MILWLVIERKRFNQRYDKHCFLLERIWVNKREKLEDDDDPWQKSHIFIHRCFTATQAVVSKLSRQGKLKVPDIILQRDTNLVLGYVSLSPWSICSDFTHTLQLELFHQTTNGNSWRCDTHVKLQRKTRKPEMISRSSNSALLSQIKWRAVLCWIVFSSIQFHQCF